MCLLSKSHNPKMTKQKIENKLCEYLNCTEVLWIKDDINPQETTAKEAVEFLGKYVEEYGASEANGVLIADPTEVWYFEIGSCHHWIAVKVPEECYLVISNCMRVHGVDLSDKDFVMHSKGLFKFVKENKLLDNPICENFNFAKAFGQFGITMKISLSKIIVN